MMACTVQDWMLETLEWGKWVTSSATWCERCWVLWSCLMHCIMNLLIYVRKHLNAGGCPIKHSSALVQSRVSFMTNRRRAHKLDIQQKVLLWTNFSTTTNRNISKSLVKKNLTLRNQMVWLRYMSLMTSNVIPSSLGWNNKPDLLIILGTR